MFVRISHKHERLIFYTFLFFMLRPNVFMMSYSVLIELLPNPFFLIENDQTGANNNNN